MQNIYKHFIVNQIFQFCRFVWSYPPARRHAVTLAARRVLGLDVGRRVGHKAVHWPLHLFQSVRVFFLAHCCIFSLKTHKHGHHLDANMDHLNISDVFIAQSLPVRLYNGLLSSSSSTLLRTESLAMPEAVPASGRV